MSLVQEYRASLKPLDVEEPIDVYVHRPLGFIVAKLSMPTPITPNFITLCSILAGVLAGVMIYWPGRFHMLIAGLLIFLSAVLDCADGQLARMRKSFSAFGRALDGTADSLVMLSVVPASVYAVWLRYNTPTWLGVTVLALSFVTVLTSSWHTGVYDHYKNVFLRLTNPTFKEGEDYETAFARWKATHATQVWWKRVTWRFYLFYVSGQRDYVAKLDPWTSLRLNLFPAYDEQRAAIYRRHARATMSVMKTFFGVGSLVFGLAIFNAIECCEVYLAFRMVVLNAIFFLYVIPVQRKASREAFREMQLHFPDQRTEPSS
jgi:phosphatidylglycerophosphate synthase